MLGPSAGGVLVQLVTAPVAILLDAVSFLISAAFLSRIKVSEATERSEQAGQRPRTAVREGLAFVWTQPVLRAVAIGSALFNFGLGISGTIGILYFTRGLDLSPAMIGLVYAGFGPGFLIGALLAGRVGIRLGVGPAIVGSTVVSSVALLATPIVEGSPRTVMLLLAGANLLTGISGEIWAINNLSLRQHITPDHLLGRTNATMRIIAFSTAPLAALAGGALGEAIGLRPTLFVGACFPFLSALVLALSPVRQVRALGEV